METVREILRHKGNDVYWVGPNTPIHDALEEMAEHDVGALLVLDEEEKLCGIFSERDYARRIIERGEDPRTIAVSEAMTTEVRGVLPERTVEECMAIMTENRVRHLPVFEDGELIGLVSIGDVVRAVIHEKEFVIDQLEHYITGSL